MKNFFGKAVLLLMVSYLPQFIISQTIMNRDYVISKAINDISVENLKTVVEDLVGFHNRNNLSSQTNPTQGIGAAANYLYNKASSYIPASNGRLRVNNYFYTVDSAGTRFPRPVTLCNVVATIQGNNPSDDRMIALLAHYDSRATNGNDSISFAPGANDDGSGIACLMEMTRIISQLNIPVTVKLMFLSGEEHGLFGAKHMAQVAVQENWNLIAVINNDMIGNSNASETNTQTNTVVRVFSENIPLAETPEMAVIRKFNSAENDSPSRQLARYIKETGERYVDNMTVRLVHRFDRFGRGGDQQPFCEKGFSGVRICEVNENYDRTHQDIREENGVRYGDEVWGIDFEYVRKNTGVNMAATLNMALAPDVPQNVEIDISGLTNYTDIYWEAPQKGKKPVGYYVLIRETNQSQWEKKILIKDSLSVRLPYSKDNYFFAVQSIDEEGHESLPVFAIGVRR